LAEEAALNAALAQAGTGAGSGLLGAGSGVSALSAEELAAVQAMDYGGTAVAQTTAQGASYGGASAAEEAAMKSAIDQQASLMTKGINALNKVGGTLNKLPKPVQGMLMSSLLAPPKQQTPPPASMPPRQAQQAPPMQLAYQNQTPPPQYFAGSGGSAGGMNSGMGAGLLGQNLTPQEMEMLRRMRIQRGVA
jgi:hypothetical protein